jgi:hypothetical protein
MEASTSTTADLVASHMRVVFSIPKHRRYIYSGTPSEPILAEAAARLMSTFGGPRPLKLFQTSILDSSKARGRVVELLAEWLSVGLLEKGELGEFVARTLLTFAHDLAIEDEYRTPTRLTDAEPIFSRPISVIAFLRALLQPKFADEVLDYLPENDRQGVKLREAFKDAFINFTHFGRTGEAAMLVDEAALYAMCRGMGWTFYRQQRGVDIGIPVFLGQPDEVLNRYRMTMIFIQVKNTSRSEKPLIDIESSAFKPQFFSTSPNGPADGRPYIVIVMNLGVLHPPIEPTEPGMAVQGRKIDRPLDEQQTPSKLIRPPQAVRDQKPRLAKALPRPKHPRYAFALHGCSRTLYRVIDEEAEKHSYAQLLDSRTLLSEHPRTEDEYRNMVMGLKPVWMR